MPELGCQGALKVQSSPFPDPSLWQSGGVNEIPLHQRDVNFIYFQSVLKAFGSSSALPSGGLMGEKRDLHCS